MAVRTVLVLMTALARAAAQSSYGGVGGTYGVLDAGDDDTLNSSMNFSGGSPDGRLFVGSRSDSATNCDCPTEVAYVCGSDGNTYDNECMAQCAGVLPVLQGICYHGCMCSAVLEPFCLVPEQITFLNICMGNCVLSGGDPISDFTVLGECTGACVDCPTNAETVCDVTPEGQGNEYHNACFAECSGVKEWKTGSCDEVFGVELGPNCGCQGGTDVEFDGFVGTVCGRDGVTYDNACLADCNDISVAYSGPCEDCANCAAQGGPEVCGNRGLERGINYMNACEARCDFAYIIPESESPCDQYRTGCGCSAEVVEPVCATSSNTYMNKCFADCAGDVVESEGACEFNVDYYEPMDG